MKKASLLMVALLFIGVFFIAVTILPERAMATTLYVGGAGPGNYTTIQAAISDAGPGDTVYVYSGTYSEHLSITTTINLVGGEKQTTIVDGGGTFDVVLVTTNSARITGLTLTGSGSSWDNSGIKLWHTQNCNVSDNIIIDNRFGVFLDHSVNTTVSGNSIHSNRQPVILDYSDSNSIVGNEVAYNWDRIILENSHNNTLRWNDVFENQNGIGLSLSNGTVVEYNTVTRNWGGISLGSYAIDSLVAHNNVSWNDGSGISIWSDSSLNTVVNNSISSNGGHGIYVNSNKNNTITMNTMVGNGIFIYGRTPEHWNNHTIDELNTVNGKPVRYVKNARGGTVPLGAGQVLLANCTGVTVIGQNVSNATAGIMLGFSHNNTLLNNTANLNSFSGIRLYRSDNNTVTGNTAILNDQDGLQLSYSDNNTISNNNLSGNSWGFLAYLSDNGTLESNTVAESYRGIEIDTSSNWLVMNNTVSANFAIGIHFEESEGSVASGNTASGNYDGISLSRSSNITLTDNTMIENGIFISGYWVENWNSHTIAVSNTISGKPVHYWKDVSGGEVPAGGGQVILANCSSVTVSNQTMTNGSVAILLGYSSGNAIAGNQANSSGKRGIYLSYSNGNMITGNTLRVQLYYSDDNIVTSNTIDDNEIGVQLESSRNTTIENNAMINGGVLIKGRLVEYWNSHIIDTSNLVNGKTTVYWKDLSGGVLPPNPGQIILANCSDVVIYAQNITHTSAGIQLGFSTNITISSNNVSNSAYGLYLSHSSSNTISSNVAQNDYIGFYLHYSNGNTIIDNVLQKSELSGAYLSSSDGNKIFHNSFMANGYWQAFDFYLSTPNEWDNGYPSGGNYWSDYEGIDEKNGPNQDLSGEDALGDSPYTISPMSVEDRYPLMFRSDALIPRAPRIMSAHLNGTGSGDVTLHWAPSPDDGGGHETVVEYEVQRGSSFDSDGLGYEIAALVPNRTYSFTDGNAGEGNPISYYYRVCAVDVYGRSACGGGQAAKFTRPLTPGPSLVSIPLIQSNVSFETVLQTVEYDKAWFYDSSSQEWKWFMKHKGYRRGLQNMNHTMGIWINVTQNSNLTVAGIVPAQTTIHLHEGWNLVSFPSFNATYTIADLKVEIGVTRVEGMETMPPFPPSRLKVLADLDTLQAGYGYWVRVEADVDWIVEVA